MPTHTKAKKAHSKNKRTTHKINRARVQHRKLHSRTVRRVASMKVSRRHSKIVKHAAKKVHKHAIRIKIKAKARKIIKLKLTKAEKKRNEEKLREEMALVEIRKTDELVQQKHFLDYINKTVGSGASDILKLLVKAPKTDEDIAAQLNVKVNDVRRMLNVMNGYSIVRYDVNKDNKGWLIFKWRIDREKLGEYIVGLQKVSPEQQSMLPGNCNDFFICKKCYPSEKVVLPFDTAFESEFSCNGCGKPYSMLSRAETEALFKQVTN